MLSCVLRLVQLIEANKKRELTNQFTLQKHYWKEYITLLHV